MPSQWERLFRGAVAGVIEAGTAVRASTAELWAEIRGRAAEEGLPIGQEGFAIVRELRSSAVARRTGYERFARAGPDQPVTPELAAPDLNVRPLTVRAVQPELLVRFDATYTNFLGETRTTTVSTKVSWRPGMTVGDIYDKVSDAAERMARDENGTLFGTVEGVANLRPVTI